MKNKGFATILCIIGGIAIMGIFYFGGLFIGGSTLELPNRNNQSYFATQNEAAVEAAEPVEAAVDVAAVQY